MSLTEALVGGGVGVWLIVVLAQALREIWMERLQARAERDRWFERHRICEDCRLPLQEWDSGRLDALHCQCEIHPPLRLPPSGPRFVDLVATNRRADQSDAIIDCSRRST